MTNHVLFLSDRPSEKDLLKESKLRSDNNELFDLFCGGGGSGTGMGNAFRRMSRPFTGTFVNHDPEMLSIHEKNHPEHRHLKEDLFMLDPRTVYPPGTNLRYFWASPSCVQHSVARGNAPIEEQQRSHADSVLRWLEWCRPEGGFVENVKEFRDWGPLIQKRTVSGALVWARNNRPLKKLPTGMGRRRGESAHDWMARLEENGIGRFMVPDPKRKGEYFQRWIAAASTDYLVEHRLLRSADYGDPTIRLRLYIQLVRKDTGRRIVWPDPTHGKPDVDGNVPGGLRRWRTARDIIQWEIKGESIFTRKRPLAPATMRRLAIGLIKHSFAHYLVPGNKGFGHNSTREVDLPVQTVTCNGRGEGVAMPEVAFIMPKQGVNPRFPETREVGLPAPTAITDGRIYLAETNMAFVLPSNKGFVDANVRSPDKPYVTITTHSRGDAVAVPTVEFIIPNFSEREGQEPRTMSVGGPMMTATSHGAGGLVEAEAFILPKDAGWKCDYVHSVDYPVSTVQTTAHDNVVQPLVRILSEVEPYVVQLNGQSTALSANEPVTALTGCGHHYISSPMIVHLRGDPAKDKTCSSVDVPSNAITASGTHEILAEAFLMAIDQCGKAGTRDRTYGHDEPVKTITTKANQAVARIEIKQLEHFVRKATPDGVDASRVWALLEPLIDELKKRGRADVKPWVYVYYGSGAVGSDLDAPIPTLRTHENTAVCYPVLEIDGEFILFDLLYRMFTVLELQRAQGFPDCYRWAGSKTAQVRAIGNSVSCGIAEALTLAHYSQDQDISHFYLDDPAQAA